MRFRFGWRLDTVLGDLGVGELVGHVIRGLMDRRL